MKYFFLIIITAVSFNFSATAGDFEFKCYWKKGIRTDSVLNTMDQKIRAKNLNKLRGDGGYDTFLASNFERVNGSKKVRVYELRYDGKKLPVYELFPNKKMNLNMGTGSTSFSEIVAHTSVARYECEKSSLDVIVFLDSR
tara:strand:- start:389 stop:808 length:420 start_codon:yes stop_codon:yes gene_type:complete